MTSFLNLTALALGLLSWGLALAALCRRRFGPLNLASLTACGLALLLQLMEVKHLATDLEDFSAILDTIHAVVLAGSVLLLAAAALNLTALLRVRSCDHEKNA